MRIKLTLLGIHSRLQGNNMLKFVTLHCNKSNLLKSELRALDLASS